MTVAPSRPTRPILRYHGGKWRLGEWVVKHFPAHLGYLEPYAGAASILMQKPRVYCEVLNDLDGEIVALHRVLRDPVQARELERVLRLTPFSRTEFEASYIAASDPIECARRLIVRAFMAHGSDGATRGCKTGFRNTSGIERGNRAMGTTPARAWSHYPDAIPAFTARLQGVLIENMPALRVIRQFDTADMLHYVDPPYVWSTRGAGDTQGKPDSKRHGYRHEMTDDDHQELSEMLCSCKGMVVISGYPSPLYDELYAGWHRVERQALADGARVRTECLWLNDAAAGRLQKGLDL